MRLLAALGLLVAVLAGTVAWLNLRGEAALDMAVVPQDAATVARGAYLARAGNCMGCHTAPGGVAYAGGRPLPTPFGCFYAPNLTPDDQTGLGRWSAAEFWRALHHGRSRDGRLLYPVFPYPSYTWVTRADADALYAFLRSLAPVAQPARPHALRFPYDQPGALALWRALYFRPQAPEDAWDQAPDTGAQASAEWRRGRYLVRGLGHCGACHAPRNALGASMGEQALSGGLMPMQNWYAPALSSAAQAGVVPWSPAEVVQLLKTGRTDRATLSGPMAEVVHLSTQYLSEADLRAMAVYLQALPPTAPAPAAPGEPATAAQRSLGAQLYGQHCKSCHGAQGQGRPPAYPPLAGNRTVTLPASALNLVQVLLHGGFAPSTAGNPRPYGMPPFAQQLSDAELAALASYLRSAWGHQASAVSALEVQRAR